MSSIGDKSLERKEFRFFKCEISTDFKICFETINLCLCLNPEKSQAIVIGFPGFRGAAVQSVSMGSAAIPFGTRVKNLGLTINSIFAWDDQINIVCRRVYFTLKCLTVRWIAHFSNIAL
jgi:hypothetical protein